MPTYRVNPDQLLPHAGQVLKAGAVVGLPRHVGAELRHLVTEIDGQGAPVAPLDPWALAVETARAHERRDVLQAERAKVVTRLGVLTDVARDRRQEAADANAQVATVQAELDRLDAALTAADAPVPVAPTSKGTKSRPANGSDSPTDERASGASVPATDVAVQKE